MGILILVNEIRTECQYFEPTSRIELLASALPRMLYQLSYVG